MSKKLYRKDISPRCEYCEEGISVKNGKEILCKKTGVMQPDSFCKKFRYDPLKRSPEILKIHSDFTAEDFSL